MSSANQTDEMTVLDVAEVAEKLKCSRQAVRELARTNRLPHMEIGSGKERSHYRFTLADVKAFMRNDQARRKRMHDQIRKADARVPASVGESGPF